MSILQIYGLDKSTGVKKAFEPGDFVDGFTPVFGLADNHQLVMKNGVNKGTGNFTSFVHFDTQHNQENTGIEYVNDASGPHILFNREMLAQISYLFHSTTNGNQVALLLNTPASGAFEYQNLLARTFSSDSAPHDHGQLQTSFFANAGDRLYVFNEATLTNPNAETMENQIRVTGLSQKELLIDDTTISVPGDVANVMSVDIDLNAEGGVYFEYNLTMDADVTPAANAFWLFNNDLNQTGYVRDEVSNISRITSTLAFASNIRIGNALLKVGANNIGAQFYPTIINTSTMGTSGSDPINPYFYKNMEPDSNVVKVSIQLDNGNFGIGSYLRAYRSIYK